jgi:hypothetical protein
MGEGKGWKRREGDTGTKVHSRFQIEFSMGIH